MMMLYGGTGFVAKCIFQTSLIIQHFVNKTLVKKGFQGSVNRYTVQGIFNFFFNISVGERMIFLKEKVKNFLTVWSGPEFEVPQQCF